MSIGGSCANQGVQALDRFHELQDGAAILVSKGVYKQVKLFTKGDELYAQHGGGFIRMYLKGTSLPNLRVEAYDVGSAYKVVVGDFDKLHVRRHDVR